ncbi:copper chaperone PCu(A)C [Bosea sp. PAMC 26642]|uniref:copper chaperone PCu(A)C n=1 Tax=Bosea sp. (strain PAMC 26642) TaxID=1792307 RepID=UPI0007700C76|nr:copper chaperone PCu(A)C [Bosea sp. PAMC 26642]AMJ62232.1 hypothetical protein AXW83_19745 [Bosea sp. PAMC 26642]
MNKPLHYIVAVALTLTSAASFAHDYKAGSLKIGHPWSRATPAGAKVGGGYLSIENTGTEPDRLVSISAAFSGRIEVHEMATTDGIMTMRPLDAGLVIPAGGKVELKPGGFHIMFMDLQQPLKQDERLKGVLTFEKAGPVEVEFKVEGIGAKGGDGVHATH